MSQDTFRRVVDRVAATTRYPRELLTEQADLEDDLGIDSVKRLEIVVALGEEFGIDLDTEQYDASIRTIGKIANWIDGLLGFQEPNPAVPENRIASALAKPQGREALGTQKLQTPEHQVSPAIHAKRGAWNRVSSPHSPLPPPRFRSADLESQSAGPLAGQVALVTGSGRGVGSTIARVLAARGATVIINSFHSREQGEQTAAEIRAHGQQAIHLWGSVANPEHVDQIFSQIEEQFGQLDILVCNASDGRIGPFLELTPDDWERAFRTNVTGHYQCAVRAAELMRATGGGSIVTMSAVGAGGFIDGLGSQGVVKAAVETLTRYLACELGQFGIRVNCVAGGPVYGDLLSKFPEARATQNHWECMTPDGQLCSPMDLANAIGFLVSNEARGINGSVWMVDHGFSAIADGRPIRKTARDSFQFSAV